MNGCIDEVVLFRIVCILLIWSNLFVIGLTFFSSFFFKRGLRASVKGSFVERLTTIVQADKLMKPVWDCQMFQWLQIYTISNNCLLSKQSILECVHYSVLILVQCFKWVTFPFTIEWKVECRKREPLFAGVCIFNVFFSSVLQVWLLRSSSKSVMYR